MTERVSITVLVENSVTTRGLKAEHGVSMLITCRGKKLLFDTGQTDLLLQNVQTLGLSLQDLDAVVLSHGHYDHTGGAQALGQAAPRAAFYAHPAALDAKFSPGLNGAKRFIGFDPAAVGDLRERFQFTRTPTEIIPGVFVTGEIPRRNPHEDTGGDFYLDPVCTIPDPLLDDQALFFDTEQGVVVVLGCAHAGVVNTLEFITELTQGRPLNVILGGMHLLHSSPERMRFTLEALRMWNPNRIIPIHCTGASAAAQIWATFPNACSSAAVGTTLAFRT